MKRIIDRTETVDIDLPEGKSAAFTRKEKIEEFQASPMQAIALTFIICFALSFAIARQIQVNNYETYRQETSQYQDNF
jgi:DNA-binding transcriptional regulator of glucitol operon